MSAGNTTQSRTSSLRDSWNCVEDNFLIQLVKEPTREGILLVLLSVNREELTGYLIIEGCLGQSDCEMIKFSIL